MILNTYTEDEEIKESLIRGFNMMTYSYGLVDHGFHNYNHNDSTVNSCIIEQSIPIGEYPFGVGYPDYRNLNVYDLPESLTGIMFFSNHIFIGKDSSGVTFPVTNTSEASLLSDILSSSFMACMNEDIGLCSALLQSAYQVMSLYDKPDKQVNNAVHNNSYTIINNWR